MGGKNFPWFCSLLRVYVYPYMTIVTCLSSNDDNDGDDADDEDVVWRYQTSPRRE